MDVTTRSGRRLTDADLDALADQAEHGFDLLAWRPRPGRPRLDPATTAHAPRLSVRVPAPVRDRLAARAAREGRTVSEVLRTLIEAYAADGDGVPKPRA
jgi:hypothetical protein